jgi:hypothetical protein
MRTMFEIALIVLCFITFICPLALPKEISGKNIAGGCCYSTSVAGPRCGLPCLGGCTVCIKNPTEPGKDIFLCVVGEGGQQCTQDYCTQTRNCLNYTTGGSCIH